MLTLFTIPKPFKGHIAIIQRNAIQSWLKLKPACEIILMGDDEGTADVAKEFGVRHIPKVARNQQGTPLLNSLFSLAQNAAQYPLLAYINTDILLLDDFLTAVQNISFKHFIMVGQRWNIDLNQPIDFNQPHWQVHLRNILLERGELFDPSGIDYFVFPKGLWGDIPAFAIGRTVWDNWLIYSARAQGCAVIDATQVVTAIHQNHDYSHASASGGKNEIWNGAEAQHNFQIAGGWPHIFTLYDSTHLLTTQGLRPALDWRRLWRRLNTLHILHPKLQIPLFPLRLLAKLINYSHPFWSRLRPTSNLGDS